MAPKVVILGGGVSGLSAAHELVERGFAVEVFEARSIAGGKARSLSVLEPSSHTRSSLGGNGPARPGPHAKPWLPGEHGFRFFPRFYRHVVDTMARIPFGAGGNVAHNLVDTTRVHVARFDSQPFYLPARFPHTPGDFQTCLHTVLGVLGGNVGLSPQEVVQFATKLWQFFTSCEERRLTEYELVSWWSFIEAADASEGYKRFFGHGITRSLVAAKARRASTKTIGTIFGQMLLDVFRPGVATDRVLNGPTSDVWIDPWLTYLRQRGVVYHFDATVKSIDCAAGVVRGATLVVGGREVKVGGDHFIAAVPVERMAELLSPGLLAADPSLASISTLKNAVEWMNGIQFYLTEDVPIAHGHTIYLDSPWALTSVSQPQFWSDYDLSDYGDGMVRGIISVDISNWTVPGLNGKPANECTRDEVADEVWQQLKRSLNVGGLQILRDDQLHSWFLDADIMPDPARPGREVNTEPLLVNYVDTWKLRPEAVTRIPNFFVAGDYVRTTTDLATMEAANESARRAVNGILNASRSGAAPCRLWKYDELPVLAPLRAYDLARFRQGLAWDPQVTSLVNAALSVAAQVEGVAALGGPDAPGAEAARTLQKSAQELVGVAHTFVGAPQASLADLSPAPARSGDRDLEAPQTGDDVGAPPTIATPSPWP